MQISFSGYKKFHFVLQGPMGPRGPPGPAGASVSISLKSTFKSITFTASLHDVRLIKLTLSVINMALSKYS